MTAVVIVVVGILCFLIGSLGVWLVVFRPALVDLIAERDECQTGWNDALALCGEWSGTNAKTQGLVDHWRRMAEGYADDAAFEEGKRAAAELAADQHAERNVCLRTLDGIRADTDYRGEPLTKWERDLFDHPIDEPPISAAVREADVVSIKRKAKR